tara:strand:- start:104 stop:367 length:264 start_codon:yes stop_codon:yes gene_type:complete
MATQNVTIPENTDETKNINIYKNNVGKKKVSFCLKVDNDSEEENYYQNKYFSDIPTCPICEEYNCYKKVCGDIIDEELDREEYWSSN